MLLLTKPTTCRKKEIGVKTEGQQQRTECVKRQWREKKKIGTKIEIHKLIPEFLNLCCIHFLYAILSSNLELMLGLASDIKYQKTKGRKGYSTAARKME